MPACDRVDRETGLRPDISVIVCTRNRASSLKITLEHLAAADRDGIKAEVVVADNGSDDDTREVAQSFSGRIALRYLYEPTLGVFGKSHALNRALDAGELGEIIAILDDDMTVQPGWFQGVAAICRRWPDKDLFTGDTYVIWPCENVPAWAKKQSLQGGIFSSVRVGEPDAALENGYWFPGGHFWFRSRLLKLGRRFQDTWLTEPDFQLNFTEAGFSGVAAPDASAGHRIQPELLDQRVVLARARKAAEKAWVRLRPYRKNVRHSRLFHEHPLAARLFCLLNYFWWRIVYLVTWFHPSENVRFGNRLLAVERMTTAIGYFRASRGCPEYFLWRRGASQ
jgi:glycosyltransferase involved in cell wall biosynthesis